MSKLIKTNNLETKKKRNYSDASMLSILSKLPLEIISYYPHKSLYRCFSTYLRKNPSIILKVNESKSIYNKWRINEAQRRKILRNQKKDFSSNKRERKYVYTNLNEEFEYCYDDNNDNQDDDYHEYQMDKVDEQLLNLDQKIDESIDESIDDTIDEENFKKKIREHIKEINNDISCNLDTEYEIYNFIHEYIPLQ